MRWYDLPSYSGCCEENGLKRDRSSLRETTKVAPAAFQVRDADDLETSVLVGDKQE